MSKFKIPVSYRNYIEAINYSINSHDYTHEYNSQWDNNHGKMKRIFFGKLAEITIYDFCKINNYPVEADISEFWEADKFDLKINNKIIDVKSTTTDWPLQITGEKDREGIDYFCYCKVDPFFLWVEFIGFVLTEKACDDKYLINKGEEIPKSNGAIQKFDKSYFYTGEYIGFSKIFNI